MKAASACFVSQPTLSIAINKLEAKLGVNIFERFHNEIRITAGMRIRKGLTTDLL